MSNHRKLKSEKVINAMTLNQKEDRVLAKTFGTLDLERDFSKKVLNLHLRAMKTNYKQLKEKVSKIRSNLTPEEIVALKQLELAGKLKQDHAFNLNAAMKIAAAARRLKLYPGTTGRQRAKSAFTPRIHKENSKLLQSRSPTSNNMKRSNSVTGVFIDAPAPEVNARRNSADLGITLRPVSAAVPGVYDAETDQYNTSQHLKSLRPSTSVGLEREKSAVSKVSFKSAANGSPPKFTSYSSHVGSEREAGVPTSRSQRSAFSSVDDSFENNMSEELFEERRNELLQDEVAFYATLEKRKNAFLGNVDEYLKRNPPERFDIQRIMSMDRMHVNTNRHVDGTADENDAVTMAHARRYQRRNFDSNRTFTSEEAYKERGRELWKDMNKTRYLRVSDDLIDLSGVVTLAKDQLKLFRLLKTSHITRS